MAETNDALVSLLRPLGRRLRTRDALFLATRTVWLAFLGGVLVQIAGRLVPLERRVLWSVAPLIVWTAAVLGYAFLRRQPLDLVARRVDAEVHLKERLATALELESWGIGRLTDSDSPPDSLPRYQPALVALQQRDALAAAQALDPYRHLPLHIARRPLALAAALSVAAGLLAFLPNPMDEILVRRAAVREELERQAENVEALQEEIQGQEELSPEDREELLKQLEELVKELRANRGDPEEALADLSRVEEALRQRLDLEAGARAAALEQMAADLTSLSDEGRPKDAAEMAERLQELAAQLDEMEDSEREALARAWERMASQVAPTDAPLAQALAFLANAARQGDSTAAAQAAQAAARALSQAARDLATQEALNRALSQLQRSSRQVAQSGPQGQASAPGQGVGQELGPGQGQGQGQGGQGGTSARTLPPGQWPGRMGEPDRPNRPEAVGELDEVYAPWLRPGGEGEEAFIPGREGAGGETTVRTERDSLPGTESEALVPYSDVYATYREAAAQAMERETIPMGLKDYVREYFSRLEP
jgi:hypothetical protein